MLEGRRAFGEVAAAGAVDANRVNEEEEQLVLKIKEPFTERLACIQYVCCGGDFAGDDGRACAGHCLRCWTIPLWSSTLATGKGWKRSLPSCRASTYVCVASI